MNTELTQRFSGAEWFNEMRLRNISIVGVGGTGSWAAIALARLGINSIHICDIDTVDIVNMAGQNYGLSDVGYAKVNAIQKRIWDMCPEVGIYTNILQSAPMTEGDLIICTDSMTSRRELFMGWKDNAYSRIFMDGRLTAEYYQILCMSKDDKSYIEEYENKYLFSDEEVEAPLCSYRQTTFEAMQIGGMMAQIYVNKVCNICDISERTAPFYTSFNGANLWYEIR